MTTRTSYWLTDALERGRHLEAAHNRTNLAAEARFMAERRREGIDAARGVAVLFAVGAVVWACGIWFTTPVPNGASLIAAPLLALWGLRVLRRVWGGAA